MRHLLRRDDGSVDELEEVNRARRRARVFVVALLIFGVAATLTGCSSGTGTAAPTPSASRGVPFGSDYSSGECPSAAAASKALGTVIALKSSRLKGYEFDCSYQGPGRGSVLIGYNYNDSLSAVAFLHDLEQFTERADLHAVPKIGTAAYEAANAKGEISVVAIAHGYTIDLLADGGTATGDEQLERIAVNAWSG